MSRNFETGILAILVMHSLRMNVAVKGNKRTVIHVSIFNILSLERL